VTSGSFDNATKQLLERLFGMATGYVLDFTNSTFASFVRTAVGFSPYERYDGSKAIILRHIWLEEPSEVVAKLNLDLLERWRINKLANDEEITTFEQDAYDRLVALFSSAQHDEPSPETLTFLDKDFGEVDVAALPSELTSQQIIRARLDEIERCLTAEAPLAVIFLAGSTLEGLLMELAIPHAPTYTASAAAPKHKGSVKPLDTWTLAELITVSRALNVLGEDVSKHADQVRNFRNYIHPRQQLRERFEPRMETARIAHQVLVAALADLQRLHERGSAVVLGGSAPRS
jgi:hypothetical protein